MSFPPDRPASTVRPDEEPYILAEIAPTDEAEVERTHRFPLLPVFLFLACCVTTYLVAGPVYAAALMGILACHEAGHYVQAKRYRVPASVPYFIPVPPGLTVIGTMGAVIAMRGHIGSRKALYDIGISGPLAGLVPTMFCTVLGLYWSQVVPKHTFVHGVEFNEPLLFKWISELVLGPVADNMIVSAHPLAIAGWVGMFLTAVNLFPVGQLDGGHILYAMLKTKAHAIAWLLIAGALAGMVITGQYMLMPMLLLVMFFGPEHPPTANDEQPLGTGRILLGVLTLAFVIVGITPTPFIIR